MADASTSIYSNRATYANSVPEMTESGAVESFSPGAGVDRPPVRRNRYNIRGRRPSRASRAPRVPPGLAGPPADFDPFAESEEESEASMLRRGVDVLAEQDRLNAWKYFSYGPATAFRRHRVRTTTHPTETAPFLPRRRPWLPLAYVGPHREYMEGAPAKRVDWEAPDRLRDLAAELEKEREERRAYWGVLWVVKKMVEEVGDWMWWVKRGVRGVLGYGWE